MPTWKVPECVPISFPDFCLFAGTSLGALILQVRRSLLVAGRNALSEVCSSATVLPEYALRYTSLVTRTKCHMRDCGEINVDL